MRIIIFIFVLIVGTTFAQQNPKVVLHLQTADTLVHKSVVNQVANIKQSLPNAQIEVVCHGPGIEFLNIKKSGYVSKLQKMNLKDVVFAGCEFTMAQRKYKREDLVPFATTVPFGIVEILKKEQEGWLYVKLGF